MKGVAFNTIPSIDERLHKMDGVGSREESPQAIYISNHPIKQMVPPFSINTLTLHNDRTCMDPLCRRFFSSLLLAFHLQQRNDSFNLCGHQCSTTYLYTLVIYRQRLYFTLCYFNQIFVKNQLRFVNWTG